MDLPLGLPEFTTESTEDLPPVPTLTQQPTPNMEVDQWIPDDLFLSLDDLKNPLPPPSLNNITINTSLFNSNNNINTITSMNGMKSIQQQQKQQAPSQITPPPTAAPQSAFIPYPVLVSPNSAPLNLAQHLLSPDNATFGGARDSTVSSSSRGSTTTRDSVVSSGNVSPASNNNNTFNNTSPTSNPTEEELARLRKEGHKGYSYGQMITMAIESSPEKQMTLNEIYNWFMANFPFQPQDKAWKSTIRHNLSLNKAFVKVPRPAHEKGNGAYWRIDPSLASKRVR
ncbi:Forkhead box protein J3, partial [Chytridiales sp. JEL 0842]